MVERPGRVSIRGAGTPINVPQDTPQPPRPPRERWQGYFGDEGYQPAFPIPEGEQGFAPLREWLQQPPFSGSMWDPIREGYSNFKDWWAENMYERTPGGGGLSGAGDLLRRSWENMLAGASSVFNDGRQEGSPVVPSPFTGSDAAAEMMEQPAYSGPSFEEMLAQYQFDGSPYDRAAEYMQERRAAQMRAIQDMYNEYAAETQANVDRIGDIYTGAETGIGEAYGGASTAIEDAYASAQQQAADQMARLGIEEAAPAVIDPMALSQAETLSNLETNRASGLGATQQFGATAGGYASNMATVAQQQALENQRSITDQLVDQLFELEMQRAEAEQAYNPYQRMMQEMEARQAYENMVNPQPDAGALQDQAEFLYQQEQDDANLFRQYYFGYLDDSGFDQQAAREKLYSDIQSGFLGPRMKQWLESNPDMAIQLTQ